MAHAVRREATAFANAPAKGQKRPRKHDDAHLRWIRTLPCVISGKRPVEAAHVRYADPVYGKRLSGAGEKSDDRWTLPVSPELHRAQHDAGDERLFWARHGIDPLRVALALFGVTGDDEQAELILSAARAAARSLTKDTPL